MNVPGSFRCYHLIFIFCLLAGVPSCKQAINLNNLTHSTSTKDTAQIKPLIAKGNGFLNSSTDSILTVAQQLYHINNLTGNKRALVYAENFESNYYWKSANHAVAMEKAVKALADAEKWQIRDAMPELYGIIANLHKENSNYDMANKMAGLGLNAVKANKDTSGIIAFLGLKAMFVHSMYLSDHKPLADNTSLNLEYEALKMAESNPKYERLKIRFYNNIAQTYKDRGDYPKAIELANKAVVLANKYNQPRSLTYSYAWLGQAYYFMGQRDKGIDYLHKGLDITRAINEPFRQMELYEHIYECYISTKDYKPALASMNRFTDMRDSLQLNKNVKQLSELQLKYETVKKDRQIALLNQSNKMKNREIMYVLISSVIFLLLGIKLWFQYTTIQRNNDLIAHNNRLLNEALLKIAHIQSHEIRKPLASILGLMNVIKADNYAAGKEELLMVESSTQELDEKIRDIIIQAEIKTTGITLTENASWRKGKKTSGKSSPNKRS